MPKGIDKGFWRVVVMTAALAAALGLAINILCTLRRVNKLDRELRKVEREEGYA